jgi:hypothetical protein
VPFDFRMMWIDAVKYLGELDDVRLGKSDYVTMATDPRRYGQKDHDLRVSLCFRRKSGCCGVCGLAKGAPFLHTGDQQNALARRRTVIRRLTGLLGGTGGL